MQAGQDVPPASARGCGGWGLRDEGYSRTATTEAHWARVLGADLAEGSQRPAGIPGAWGGEAARLSDPPGRGVFAPFLDSFCLALLPTHGS